MVKLLKRAWEILNNKRGSFGGSSKQQKAAAAGITAAGDTEYSRTQATPQETQQYSGSFDIGSALQQYIMGQLGLGPQTGQNAEQQYQNQGPLAQSLYNTVSQQAANPYQGWESSLQPNLQLAQQNIDQTYNSRGLMQGGLPIEQMGRAGVELAVADAQNRMAYGQQALQNASGLSQQAQGVGQTNISNLGSLYGQQQTSGLQAMQRQAYGAQNAAQYQSYPYQAQLGNYYGLQSAMYSLPGQIAAGDAKAFGAAGGA